ncbi:unnamed protein product [Eruca vesicaria subsp. sativa]|uniref:PSMD12/CSN4-like N-terminal domain-containing protein n=1 Tax=Eruca vesicaria subsp. sativa TaxID=29727 RepID=A0ABC8IZ65_ERUVS|nr:unnamed protein product [Eruca vesicaria subsp. sativa]
MAKTEKIAFILEQVHLCLDRQDYVQGAPADILSLLELKRNYYELMIGYYSHNNEYLEICRSYKAIYGIPSFKETTEQWIPILRKLCWFLVLAPHDPEEDLLVPSTSVKVSLLMGVVIFVLA